MNVSFVQAYTVPRTLPRSGAALHVHLFGWIAIGCFVGLSLAVLVILWPRRDWEFVLSPAQFIETYVEPPEEKP